MSMFAYLRGALPNSKSHESRRVDRRQAEKRTFSVDALEHRCLMAAGAAPTFVGLVADPGDAAQTALLVVGSPGKDNISLKPGTTPGSIVVRFNGTVHGPFSPTGHIIANGLAGDDKIKVSNAITLSAILHGGEGHDRLSGGAGADVLTGDRGFDALNGGAGRDLLIGGHNTDYLRGHDDDDVMIGGVVDYEGNDQALIALLNEWNSTRGYDARISNLRDGSGSVDRVNGAFFLNGRTVTEQASHDRLTGNQGQDWFFIRTADGKIGDRARDAKLDERVDLL